MGMAMFKLTVEHIEILPSYGRMSRSGAGQGQCYKLPDWQALQPN